jgi:hypothetical protein
LCLKDGNEILKRFEFVLKKAAMVYFVKNVPQYTAVLMQEYPPFLKILT